MYSQTSLGAQFCLGNEGKEGKTLCPRLGLEVPDMILPDVSDHPIKSGMLGGGGVIENSHSAGVHREADRDLT